MVSCRVIRAVPDPETERAWREYLEDGALFSHYVSPEYFLEPHIEGSEPFAIVAELAGRVTGVLTGCRCDGDLISGMPHRPQLILANGETQSATEEALVRAIVHEAKKCRRVIVYSWNRLTEFEKAGFNVRPWADTLLLDLSKSNEEIFERFSATKRNVIRQAERKGVEVASTYEDLELEQLLEAFRETATRHKLSAKSRTELKRLLQLQQNRKLFIAKVGDQVIAGTVIRFQVGGLAEYSENASLKSAWHYHPNETLLWHAIRWSRAQGCRAFDFGGYSSFKEGFGAQLVPIFRLRRGRTFLDRAVLRVSDRAERMDEMARKVVRSMLRRWRMR